MGLVSLGCSKNLVDTQSMCGALVKDGVDLSPSPDDADVVLVNTCAFIQAARDEAEAEIARALSLKRDGRVGAVVVTGCYAQRYGHEAASRFPDVDAWIGVDAEIGIAPLVKRLARRGAERRRAIVRVATSSTCLFEPPVPELRLTGGPFAYLKIADGCNHACAYCAIPGIRGRLRSRRIDDVVREAEALLSTGVRELDIVAQDVTAFGRDRRDGRLPDLLRALDSIGGDFWIRLLYGYPSLVDDDLLECFATLDHLCPYIDIPIQHSHPDVLRAMLRADTIRPLPSLISRLREAKPGMAVRTTCLVGFPGETEEHFRHLCDFVRESRFDALGAFAFSPEEGTPAATMAEQVPPEVAEERLERLMRVQKTVVRENRRSRIGSRARALLLGRTAQGRWTARTEWQAPDVDGVTHVSGLGRDARVGDFADVVVTAGRGYDFSASPASLRPVRSGRMVAE